MAKETEKSRLDRLAPIESTSLNLSEFEGQKKEIVTVEMVDTTTPYDEEGNYHADLRRNIKVLRVATGPITTIDTPDGKKDIVASELFNLKQNPETGEWGWSSSDKAKLKKFMGKMKVKHPNELKGKAVVVRVRSKEGSDNEFLGFFTQ